MELTYDGNGFAMMVVKTIIKNYFAPGYRAHFRKCECSEINGCNGKETSHEIFIDVDGPGEFCNECGMVTQ